VRSQTNRLKNGLLEGLIASGDSLSVDELSRLMQLPTARSMFSKLLLRNQDGVIGLFHPDRMTLTDVAGAIHPAGSNLKVVHPYDLYLTDTLAAWQRDIVHRRIVQPIKQVFRELYLLTPAEQTTNTYSNRFAGQVVDGSIAAKLLATRGWRFDYGATPLPYKDFPHLQLRAIFSFPDVFHYFGENRIITADRILFQRYPLYKGFYATVDSDGIPLEEVPPLVFSEVMRDADLVVSVGQRDGEAKLSAEAYQRRGDVVRSLLDDLGLAGVEVDGHFAYVQGKLAWYRVHLGSAVIHIEPGNYLCIVPSHWGQRHERLFLPFADEADNKISEVISKILFLLADDRITDHSILRQIHRSL
jgi:hypothetical protein